MKESSMKFLQRMNYVSQFLKYTLCFYILELYTLIKVQIDSKIDQFESIETHHYDVANSLALIFDFINNAKITYSIIKDDRMSMTHAQKRFLLTDFHK